MARVRYTGEIPVVFHDLNRPPVKQGEEFDVPDAEKERYTRRDDIEDLEPDPEPEPEPTELAAEPTDAVESDTESQPAAEQPAETTAAPAEAAPPTE